MGSDETATATTGGPRVIDVFDGNGAPSGPYCLLFSGADRLLEVSRGRLGSVLYTCNRLHRMRRHFNHFWSIFSQQVGLLDHE